MYNVDLSLPRSAFSPREIARAGDVWRLFQELAVEGSTRAGWPPSRYREEGVSFVMRAMTTVHHREAAYGEPIRGRTWAGRVQRDIFFRRESRVLTPQGPLASTTQDWVHVRGALEIAPASSAMLAAFPTEALEPSIELPAFTVREPAREHRLSLLSWHTWMDPLAHVNHPMYVDLCDEALARIAADAGHDPQRIVAVAEEARFSNGVVGGVEVTVETRCVGETDAGDAVFEHRIRTREKNAAKLITVRRLAGEQGSSALLALG